MDRITIAGHGLGDSSIAVDFRHDIGRLGQRSDLDDAQIINSIRHGMAPVWSYRAEQEKPPGRLAAVRGCRRVEFSYAWTRIR